MPGRTRVRDRIRHRLGVPSSWHTAYEGKAWWHPEGDCVVATVVVTQRQRPAADGGVWRFPEAWTVILPRVDDGSQAFSGDPVAMLEDTPNRTVWWSERHPQRRVVSRVILVCGLCGRGLRDGVVIGSSNGVLLCHTDWKDGLGLPDQTDCYRLVTVYGLPLGSRVR